MNSEYLDWKERAHLFAQKTLRPLSLQLDHSESDVREVIEISAREKIRHWWIPKEYGGAGATDRLLSCIIAEEIAWGCLGLLEAVSGPPLAGFFLLHLGSESQRKKYLTPLARSANDNTIAFALTEERAGSDPSSIETIVTESAQGFVLNGAKKFITNGNIANFLVVAAKLKSGKEDKFKLFVIDRRETTGISTKRLKTSGVRSANVAELRFENCHLPAEAVLGYGERDAHSSDIMGFLRTMEIARIGVGAAAVGVARAAWEEAVAHASRRKVNGKSLIKNQAIVFSLVNSLARINAARSFVHHTARCYDDGSASFSSDANLSKMFAAEMAEIAVRDCTEIFGGLGFIAGEKIEKYYRDVRVCKLWEGTPNILRIAVAHSLFGVD